jgi:hypothetical protein
VSDWNLFLERTLAIDLTLEELRLANAVARCTLGWSVRENRVGQQFLRDLTGMHGRSFERARAGLVAKGLIDVRSGSGGRGNRDLYRLLIEPETPADEREFGGEAEMPAHEREIRAETPAQMSAETPAQTSAPERAGREKGERRKEPLHTGAIDTCYLCDPSGSTSTPHDRHGFCLACRARARAEPVALGRREDDERA